MYICFGCHRHVREVVCPFCGANNVGATPVPGPAAMRVGIRRSALIVAGALTATAPSAACSAPESSDVVDVVDVVSPGDVYGIEAGVPDTQQPDATHVVDVVEVVSAGDVYGVEAGLLDTQQPDATDVDDVGSPSDR